METETKDMSKSKGGLARADSLTPEQRREIAQNAAKARWGGNEGGGGDEMLHSLLQGEISIGPIKLECHVLNDHRRVITQREMVRVISGGRESGDLKRYLENNPLINNELIAGQEIHFRVGKSNVAIGREATSLIEICEKYLEAEEQGKLKPSQIKLAKQAQIIIRASAKIGIIALIDEATGFQKIRDKRALQLKLQAFIAEDMQEWAITFPDEFWLELARLEGIKYSPRSRPLRWGKYVMAFVYDAIDKDIGKNLRKINPDPHHKKNHHQWLKEFGKEKVSEQITKVTTIMKLCDDMDDFKAKFRKVFRKTEGQADLFYDIN